MKVSDLMYCYGAGVSYHIYQKPYMTKLIDCGVTTFNALLDQPTMLDREVICHMHFGRMERRNIILIIHKLRLTVLTLFLWGNGSIWLL